VMSRGLIEQLGTPNEIYNVPKTLFVGRFVGESNVFSGRVVSSDGDSGRVEVGGVGVFAGVSPAGLERGASADVLVRPEALRVADPSRPADAGVNRFSGRVDQVIYL